MSHSTTGHNTEEEFMEEISASLGVEFLSEWPPADARQTSHEEEEADYIKPFANEEECIMPPLSEARSALAAFCRQSAKSSIPTASSGGHSAKATLNTVKRTTEGRNFLRERMQRLVWALERKSGQDRSRLLHVLATFAFELGEFAKAEKYSEQVSGNLSKACVRICTIEISFQACEGYTRGLSSPLEELLHEDYLTLLQSISEEAREALWFRHKVRLSALAEKQSQLQQPKLREAASVERRDFAGLSAEEFRQSYVSKGRPLVIIGAMEESVGPHLWNLDFVSKHGGEQNLQIAMKRKMHELKKVFFLQATRRPS